MIRIIGRSNEQARDAWLAETLSRLPPGSRLLDAGAGEQRNRKWCDHLVYVSQDFGRYEGTGNGVGLQTGHWDTSHIDIVCDITRVPQPDGSFDAIVCTEVLEHLPDPLSALAEFSRLLKPGGKLILTAPFCSLTHFAPFHFASGFSCYWYREHLPVFMFEILELTPNGNWFEYLAQEIWRLPNMGRYSSRAVCWAAGLLAFPLLLMLTVASRLDKKSSELLCFGWHVVARKISAPIT